MVGACARALVMCLNCHINLFFRVKPENEHSRVISSKRISVGEISEDT